MNDGCAWVVDIDLEEYFDTVNHDKLMVLVAREIKDKRLLKLIRAYLNSGVIVKSILVCKFLGILNGIENKSTLVKYSSIFSKNL